MKINMTFKLIDLSNKRFGKLLVIKRHSSKEYNKKIGVYWDCECDCGNMVIVRRDMLTKNNKKCCGCTKIVADVGERFGSLVVTKILPNKQSGDYMVTKRLCKCDCGKEIETYTNSLSRGKSKSCGCSKQAKPLIGKIHKKYWYYVVRGAKDRNLEFLITPEDAWNKFMDQKGICALSGIKLKFSDNPSNQKPGTASLDRIDSSKGYTIDNIQWVHKKVNIMKNKLLEKDFIKFCEKIVNNSSKLEIDYALLTDTAKPPQKSDEDDAGWDLFCDGFEECDNSGEIIRNSPSDFVIIYPGQCAFIKTGIATAIPKGWFAKLEDRSGMGLKGTTHTGGVIDSRYRGEWKICLYNVGQEDITIKKGDKVIQFVLHRVPKVKFNKKNNLDETTRGAKGFGSSG